MSENPNAKGPARWRESWWIHALAAALWAYGLIFTIEISTAPNIFRIAAGAACALLLFIRPPTPRRRSLGRGASSSVQMSEGTRRGAV